MQETQHSWRRPDISLPALRLFAHLLRRGGSVRVRTLLRRSGFASHELYDALNELQERGWIRVRRRTPRSDLPERLREVYRVTTTHQGRLFAPRLWLID